MRNGQNMLLNKMHIGCSLLLLISLIVIGSDARTRFTRKVCSLPVEEGPCKALKRQFYHNASSGQCEAFNYGGCQGNANRFLTLKACQQACEMSV